MRKDHTLSKGTLKFGISERMRGLLCLLGQSVVYEEASELFATMLGIDICTPQIQRVCTYYGKAIDPLVKADCEAVIPRLESGKGQDKMYVMVDGSMVYTRDQGWRELKLGRLFHDSQVVNIQAHRREVLESVYVSHLGSVEEFFPKFERHLVGYTDKVIIGDGAKWIWNWADDNYPGATQILDFYHAKEKLVLFARAQYREEQTRLNWIEQQTAKLLDNGLEEVLLSLRSCRANNQEAKLAKQKAIDYYVEHDDRMQYKTYREQGLMIGSGPIEAAHRSVIQQRMKLSGQKWSVQGAQAIANLRCYKHSGAWNLVKAVIAAAA
ncbi:hypothetical protein CRP01_41665 [Flavilitoribacter nigricans DSM 23189 = NBRC 102662]|uniref:ISKra4 family transposase n=1 Tax=Flavilitoribacter nigricans (strain ATCC 23147 / DSM 23189 / NBRC 102662 / NCIMB 1420 / SS-2) TaxID=1122177 RepID=A0A2D0MWG8_FLAN2|nr:hypothetical protein CRP01_41665 [Flavilitoribacter nigricans DSM 23189 = NBRC 102662]